ncbi:MAG: hypothetical protein KME07_08930 [Pegethrix bostrychoides GSE-TBD4-15B]|uniref:Uncharacterized protein n=1 Tax=Pegethrix bostrychoides GSE-TBD4-15B TaxID=2839662 RepID=A0A951PAJ7_9CYAN|nr:hypothetical protein [Pegethrix bostrychoides GSE-TBD4-15B]
MKFILVSFYLIMVAGLPLLANSVGGWGIFILMFYFLPFFFFLISLPTIILFLRRRGPTDKIYFTVLMITFSLAILFFEDFPAGDGLHTRKILIIDALMKKQFGIHLFNYSVENGKLRNISLVMFITTLALHIVYIAKRTRK